MKHYEVYVDTRTLGDEWWLPETILVDKSQALKTAKEIADEFHKRFNVRAFVKETSSSIVYRVGGTDDI